MPKKQKITISQIPGFKQGHADTQLITGCTVILMENGAVAGMDVRGSAAGTRETDPLNMLHVVDRIHGLLLSGGSAFGLGAATGVMKYLEEKNVGLQVGVGRIPIVPSAVIFDLKIGDANIRPDAQMAYQACCNAISGEVESGCVGVGIGATAGKYMGSEWGMKSGFGQAGIVTKDGIMVAASVVANPYGDIIDPETNLPICGCHFQNDATNDLKGYFYHVTGEKPLLYNQFSNTVLGVIATNVALDKRLATKIARMAQNGLSKVIVPANTLFDGDVVFALSYGKKKADFNWLGAISAELLKQAILDAVYSAVSIDNFPAYQKND